MSHLLSSQGDEVCQALHLLFLLKTETLYEEIVWFCRNLFFCFFFCRGNIVNNYCKRSVGIAKDCQPLALWKVLEFLVTDTPANPNTYFSSLSVCAVSALIVSSLCLLFFSVDTRVFAFFFFRSRVCFLWVLWVFFLACRSWNFSLLQCSILS